MSVSTAILFLAACVCDVTNNTSMCGRLSIYYNYNLLWSRLFQVFIVEGGRPKWLCPEKLKLEAKKQNMLLQKAWTKQCKTCTQIEIFIICNIFRPACALACHSL